MTTRRYTRRRADRPTASPEAVRAARLKIQDDLADVFADLPQASWIGVPRKTAGRILSMAISRLTDYVRQSGGAVDFEAAWDDVAGEGRPVALVLDHPTLNNTRVARFAYSPRVLTVDGDAFGLGTVTVGAKVLRRITDIAADYFAPALAVEA